MNKVSWMLSGVIAAIVVGFGAQTFATTESIWLGASGALQKEIIQTSVADSTSTKYCTNTQKFELEYKTILSQRLYSTKKPLNECWFQTKYGAVADTTGGYLYIQSFKGANVVRVNDSTWQRWHPLPGSSSIALSTNNGSSFFYGLYIVDDVPSKLTLREDGSRDLYYLDRLDAWRLKSPDGNPMSVNAVGVSANGAWMAVESSSGFLRINVQTKEIKKFENRLHIYGIGANPNYELTVSNDGRYVILNGGPMGTVLTNLYDLDRCVDDNEQYVSNTVQCEKLDLVAAVSTAGTRQHTKRPIFSDDATNITLDIKNGTQYDRYIVAAPGYDLHGMDYLALGDSYTSGEGEYDGKTYYVKGTDGDGEGVPGFDTGLENFPYKSEKCHLSTRSYPYLLAATAGLGGNQYKSVACSGSKINDVMNEDSKDDVRLRYNGRFEQFTIFLDSNALISSKAASLSDFTPGRASQIEFIKKYKPKVATIGIGGNDIQFGAKIAECVMPGTCSSAEELRHYTGLEIRNLHKKLVATYTTLSNAGPTTKFYVVGYPQIISEDDTCASNVRLNSTERTLAHNMTSYLNQVIKSAAESVGFTYFDVEYALAGEMLCDESYDGKAVRGLVVGDDYREVGNVGPITFVLETGNESFHPTHVGHEMIRSAIETKLDGSTLLDYRSCALLDGLRCPSGNTAPPEVPPYFLAYNPTTVQHVVDTQTFESVYTVDNKTAMQRGTSFEAAQPVKSDQTSVDLAPNQTVDVVMHSEPRVVGQLTVNQQGQVNGTVTIPEDTVPGPHTLVVRAKDSLYEDNMFYQHIFVYESIDDLDGDGIANEDEPCGILEPIGEDVDRDGIDDGCDETIEDVDETPPTVTAVVDQQPNQHGWYNQAVTIRWQVVDDRDGEMTVADTAAELEGEQTYQSPEVCDAAGNCVQGNVTLKIDRVSPTITSLAFSKNPKNITELSLLLAQINDAHGIQRAQYFIGETGNLGSDADMQFDNSQASVELGTDFGTGVYKLTVRVQDMAGNWSQPASEYLVVYDASANLRAHGTRMIPLGGGQHNLPWVQEDSTRYVKFAFSVRYDKSGAIARQSDFQLVYTTQNQCGPKHTDCHRFTFNASEIEWLTSSGANSEIVNFGGKGILRTDEAERAVSFVVSAQDGFRAGFVRDDAFAVNIYDGPTGFTSPLLYYVSPTDVQRGNIRISR